MVESSSSDGRNFPRIVRHVNAWQVWMCTLDDLAIFLWDLFLGFVVFVD